MQGFLKRSLLFLLCGTCYSFNDVLLLPPARGPRRLHTILSGGFGKQKGSRPGQEALDIASLLDPELVAQGEKEAQEAGETPAAVTMCCVNRDKPYSQCCKKFHTGKEKIKDPEDCIRARFCATVLKKTDFLMSSCVPGGKMHKSNVEKWEKDIKQMYGQGTFTDYKFLSKRKDENDPNKAYVNFSYAVTRLGERQDVKEDCVFIKDAEYGWRIWDTDSEVRSSRTGGKFLRMDSAKGRKSRVDLN
uniref:YchJ-like middle NTF2-like domain-containing protein n=1 Tax=Chromera velia CCMP2878 TaxID=1169474 RepID=A0A0G4GT24_9ALVE|mmetsp:Transcript_37105/g.73006  ORF Transcript_37105/g.73006 Transcript_37105/m.73006 type:complete len:246 (-) Transcript_37105:607-1344(-)|eukprot:Cvel_23261.t1-p1 / transcript=Cvel_23261.t1 / gene=Cvel_23261 / organism=Chromera_velia_CCMP2878 / gene_product=hypothetical protein / transcript_product=hypothetical protein / location=Cvel_scaffold2378:1850-2584(-) / protein_length=245 / sequence_SO=supercontig / SO=protein_coding / is_pseudo=false